MRSPTSILQLLKLYRRRSSSREFLHLLFERSTLKLTLLFRSILPSSIPSWKGIAADEAKVADLTATLAAKLAVYENILSKQKYTRRKCMRCFLPSCVSPSALRCLRVSFTVYHYLRPIPPPLRPDGSRTRSRSWTRRRVPPPRLRVVETVDRAPCLGSSQQQGSSFQVVYLRWRWNETSLERVRGPQGKRITDQNGRRRLSFVLQA